MTVDAVLRAQVGNFEARKHSMRFVKHAPLPAISARKEAQPHLPNLRVHRVSIQISWVLQSAKNVQLESGMIKRT